MTLQQAITITSVKGTNFEMGWSVLPKSLMLLKVTYLGIVCSHEMYFKNNHCSFKALLSLEKKKEYMVEKSELFSVSTNNEFC